MNFVGVDVSAVAPTDALPPPLAAVNDSQTSCRWVASAPRAPRVIATVWFAARLPLGAIGDGVKTYGAPTGPVELKTSRWMAVRQSQGSPAWPPNSATAQSAAGSAGSTAAPE